MRVVAKRQVARLAAAADCHPCIAADQLPCFIEDFDVAAEIERTLRNRRRTHAGRSNFLRPSVEAFEMKRPGRTPHHRLGDRIRLRLGEREVYPRAPTRIEHARHRPDAFADVNASARIPLHADPAAGVLARQVGRRAIRGIVRRWPARPARARIRFIVGHVNDVRISQVAREPCISIIFMTNLTARAATTIEAPVDRVWDALINPNTIKQYMFGTNVTSDFKEGSPILFKGEFQGKAYEDKGVILRLEHERMIQYSHFSPLTGLPDKPENYHTVTIELSDEGARTRLSLSQDNNSTEEDREHSEKNWEMMLANLKQLLEK